MSISSAHRATGKGFPLTEADQALCRELIDHFLPEEIFDAHAHLFDTRFTAGVGKMLVDMPDGQYAWEDYRENVTGWMQHKAPAAGLFFPFPSRDGDADQQNVWLAEQLVLDPDSRGLLLITPDSNPERIADQLQNKAFVGFKVYHCYAPQPPTFDADCEAFIPNWAWELSQEHGLAIMLHIVKRRALADPANQTYIRQHCERYPNAKLILAHAGRSFCSQHTVEGIASLRGLENVWFDTSAICEPAPFEAILAQFGPCKLLFGTDSPVSEMRAKCVSLGDGFLWSNDVEPNWQKSPFAQPTLVGIESLIALRQACQLTHMSEDDIQLMFAGGAKAMLGIPSSKPATDVQQQYRRAKEIIPGGTQLLSKRPEMFAPDVWPAYYREARGCEIIDTSGRALLDMSSGGILATILGYADPDVNAAVIRRVQMGSMSTLQTHDEVELAELLTEIHPWAEMARFTRTGGESMAVAVRIARAATGRDQIALCGYHGWHDWYLAANLASDQDGKDALAGHLLPGLDPAGVPQALAGSANTFAYNRLDQLDDVIAKSNGKLAAIVMETTRHIDPEPGFLEGVRERANRAGAVLILDEISIGWRLCLGGAHLKYGIEPDIAVFAKTISNGFAMGAVIGRSSVMQAAQRSFISSAYWTEGVGPAAALATVRKLKQLDVPAHLNRIGTQVRSLWQELGTKHNIPVKFGGRPEMAVLSFDHPETAALTTLMTVRMLDHGILAGAGFNPMLAHEPRHVERYAQALNEVFAELAVAIQQNDLSTRLKTPVKHSGFSRLTG